MLFKWVIWVCLLGRFEVKGQADNLSPIYKVYVEQKTKHDQLERRVDNSCFIRQKELSRDVFFVCPNDVNCYVKSYVTKLQEVVFLAHSADIRPPCQTANSTSLPVDKRVQIQAVLAVLRLSNRSVCDFSTIQTLNMQSAELAHMGQLGRANCQKVMECPYQLKFLDLSINLMDELSNGSFCAFKQLEYLALIYCGIRSIEANAFVHLVHLKGISLQGNDLTYLPADLFRYNVLLEQVDLTYNRLQVQAMNTLFNIRSIRYLFLDVNQIELNEGRATFTSGLIQLALRKNRVRNLGSVFANVTSLKLLILDTNTITEVEEEAFEDLLQVEILTLHSNQIETLGQKTFANNLKLERLSLGQNKLREFPPVAHLTRLQYLLVEDNMISALSKTALTKCQSLKYLNLTNNRLSFIEKGAFENVFQLKKLFLNNNQLSEWSADFTNANILEITIDYNNYSIFSFQHMSKSMTHLSMSSNGIDTIEPFDFIDGGGEWSLTFLDLSNNRIQSVNDLNLPPSINEMDLSDNLIRQVFPLSEFKRQQLNNLLSVKLQRNQISSLCITSFWDFTSALPISYYVSENPLVCSAEMVWIGSPPEKASGVVFADLDRTSCLSIDPYSGQDILPLSAFKSVSPKYDAPVDMNNNYFRFFSRSDYMDSTRCRCPQQYEMQCDVPCPYNCTCLSNFDVSIVYLMCFSQQFQRIPNDLKYSEKYRGAILILEFGWNLISRVFPIDFGLLNENVDVLRLADCVIEVIEEKAFDKLINLKVLTLANNQLETLPEGLFRPLAKLGFLDLSENRLKHLADDTFSHLDNLRLLFLHNNSLTHFEMQQIKAMTYLNNITLHDNPWSCDCAFIKPFQSFLVNSSIPVYNKTDISCVDNGQEFNIPNYFTEHCANQKEVVYVDHSAIWIPSLVVGVLLIIVSGLVFKWRYELQVLVYSRYNFRIFHKKQPEEDSKGKQYDAFMAYNSKDEEFLVYQLMPGLESIEKPYRLCIHERDFPVGAYIQNSILEAIRVSSRTIVILSQNFVNSGWCRYEFKSAHMQMLEDRCPRILVILLGDVPEGLDPEMKLYLKTNTYLKWGEKLFWQKLYFAMPDLRVTAPATEIMPMVDM